MFKFFGRMALRLMPIVLIAGLFTIYGPEIHRSLIRKYVGDKVVMIKKGRSGGTGFYVEAPSGLSYILTNRHVCDLSKDGYLDVISFGKWERKARQIIKVHDQHDLCLVDGGLQRSGLDLSSNVRIGEEIGLVGHPKLQPLTVSRGELIGYRYIQIVTKYNVKPSECLYGKIKKVEGGFAALLGIKNYCIETLYSGQITAYSRGGSSGSPVVNFYGNLVGVLFAGNRTDQFESFIVPLTEIKEFLQDM